MSLQELKVTQNISKDALLWRYMTLDKLINLLSTHKLFFAPLNTYIQSDPFEGFIPKVVMEKQRGLFKQNMHMDITSNDPRVHNIYSEFKENANKIYYRIFKSTLVNCWHHSNHESEAMWRLYSENSKGIAIQTTVQSLIDSIDDNRIYLSEVKYLDFYDRNLKGKDCVVNGHTAPLLKRKSFEHEKEVRLFFQPIITKEKLLADDYAYKPEFIDVDISKLISKIYISPYATEPFISSVQEVIRLFKIDQSKVIYSDLLGADPTLAKLY